MTGFLFFDGERRLCMTVAEETIRPGDGVKAVVWMPETRRWGPPTTAVYVRPARWALHSALAVVIAAAFLVPLSRYGRAPNAAEARAIAFVRSTWEPRPAGN